MSVSTFRYPFRSCSGFLPLSPFILLSLCDIKAPISLPDFFQVVSLVEDFRARFYSSSSSETSPSVSNAHGVMFSFVLLFGSLYLLPFYRCCDYGLASFKRWYVALSFALATSCGPTIVLRIYSWIGVDCRDQHPMAFPDLPRSDIPWCVLSIGFYS